MKIDFSYETKHGTFADALNLPDDHTFTDEEIEAMKQARVDNWIAYLDNPPPEPPPPPAPTLEEQIADMQAKIDELHATLVASQG